MRLGWLALTDTATLANDAVMHFTILEQGLAFLLLKVTVAVITATIASSSLNNDGQSASVVQALQLGGLLSAIALLEVFAIANHVDPIVTIPFIFLFPAFALLFDASAGRTDLKGDAWAAIALNVGAILSLALGHWQQLQAVPLPVLAAVLAGAAEGFKLSFIKTAAIDSLGVNQKVFAENVVAVGVLVCACLLYGLNPYTQAPSKKSTFVALLFLSVFTGWFNNYTLYQGLQNSPLQSCVGMLTLQVIIIISFYVFLFSWREGKLLIDGFSLFLFAACAALALNAESS